MTRHIQKDKKRKYLLAQRAERQDSLLHLHPFCFIDLLHFVIIRVPRRRDFLCTGFMLCSLKKGQSGFDSYLSNDLKY